MRDKITIRVLTHQTFSSALMKRLRMKHPDRALLWLVTREVDRILDENYPFYPERSNTEFQEFVYENRDHLSGPFRTARAGWTR